MAELEDLRGEVAALRAEVAALRATVEHARLTAEPTMRRHLQCPACGCRRIAHARSVRDNRGGGSHEPLSLYATGFFGNNTVGALEAYACTECGLVEWYVIEPDQLVEHDKFMRIIDGATADDKGPYR